jgi:uncharacterized protein with FMN-binding domain
MKKTLGIVLTSVLVLSLAGCTAKTANTASNAATTTGGAATYKDGTYDAKKENKKTGYDEAIVTIKDGKIQNVDLKRLDANSKEVDYSFFDGTKDAPNLKQYRQDLAKAIVEKQSANVDTISGATLSSTGWKQSVSDALTKASK